jgi:hypothetical protein
VIATRKASISRTKAGYLIDIFQALIRFYVMIHVSHKYFSFPWLYSPIFGLSRLHETFRFISVTRSRIVSRTPWTGDQLVARTLPTAPGDCVDGEVGGMNGFGRENRSTRRKPTPKPLCPQQIPLDQTWARTRAAAVGSQRLPA